MNLLNDLPSIVKSHSKRLGRGIGSGKGGHTSGRGTKGQKSRSGITKVPLWFEGGQLPFIKRLPMQRGKGRLVSLKVVQEVNLSDVLARKITHVTPETLKEAGLIRSTRGEVRLIGAQAVETKLTLEKVVPSAPVRQAIEAAGGSVTA